MFGHADGGDRVVGPVADVAVVLHTDLDPVGEPLLGDALTGVGRLLLGEGHADHAHAVLTGRVDRHRTPAAADVEEALTRRQLQLAADEFELVALGVLQGAVRGLPVGARVDHRGAEDDLVEVVADVVVVADGAFVGALGVQVGAAARTSSGGGAGGSGSPASLTSPRTAERTSGSRRAWARVRASSPRSHTSSDIASRASYRSPSIPRSPETQARAMPSSPGFHRSLRRARRLRTTNVGASGGPASEPSHARMRTGIEVPSSCSKRDLSRSAASAMAHTSVTRIPELSITT